MKHKILHFYSKKILKEMSCFLMYTHNRTAIVKQRRQYAKKRNTVIIQKEETIPRLYSKT